MKQKGRLLELINKTKQIVPEIVVILFCIFVLSVGVSNKEGYHMDELLSFQLSNAEYNPWIVPTQPEGRLAKFIHNEIDGEAFGDTIVNLLDTTWDILKNRGNSRILSYRADIYEEPIWITSKAFAEYITVDSEDDFNYLSVYFNVKDDNHPPIHYMLLHTFSSLFKGTVHPYVGCTINIAAVVVTMVIMMKLGRMLAELSGLGKWGRFLGVCTAGLYGISSGAMASVLLIRMYSVLTMFCILLFYVHLKKWCVGSDANEQDEKTQGFTLDNKALIAVTVLGFLTQYFFLFYCVVLAGVTVVLLLHQKRLRELFVYIRSMFAAAVIGLLCFPFAISDVFASERGVEALHNLSSGLGGFGARLVAFEKILGQRTFGVGFLVVMVMAIVGIVFWEKKSKIMLADNGHRTVGVLYMLILPVLGYFLLAARMSPYLVDRYIMPLFPFVIFIGMYGMLCLVCSILNSSIWNVGLYVAYGIVLVLQLPGVIWYDGSYQYEGYKAQLKVAEEYAEYPCICVYDGVGYYENLLEFTNYSKTLLLTEAELAEREDVESVSENEKIVVLVKEEVDKERVCRILEEKYSMAYEKDLSDSIYGDKILLFSIR